MNKKHIICNNYGTPIIATMHYDGYVHWFTKIDLISHLVKYNFIINRIKENKNIKVNADYNINHSIDDTIYYVNKDASLYKLENYQLDIIKEFLINIEYNDKDMYIDRINKINTEINIIQNKNKKSKKTKQLNEELYTELKDILDSKNILCIYNSIKNLPIDKINLLEGTDNKVKKLQNELESIKHSIYDANQLKEHYQLYIVDTGVIELLKELVEHNE